MKISKLKIYIAIEVLLFIALLIFQIMYLNNGHNLFKNDGESFLPIAIAHVVITAVTFLYTITLFYLNRDKNRIREDLFVIYFLFTLIADIFFSFTNLLFIGHIFFILSYLLFMYITFCGKEVNNIFFCFSIALNMASSLDNITSASSI